MLKEILRKLIEGARKEHSPKCPCCNKEKEMAYQGFVFFNDPCVCGSGKKFKNCCYPKMK